MEFIFSINAIKINISKIIIDRIKYYARSSFTEVIKDLIEVLIIVADSSSPHFKV